MGVLLFFNRLYESVFFNLQATLDGWFTGLFARFVFAAVLFQYYFNSAFTKVGEGFAGFFSVADSAYFQIIPPIVEQFDYDPSQVPLVPWKIIVFLGTYSEFILPVLIVIGLFTRVAALGMIGFVLVQSYVDIAFHGVDEQTIGVIFDRIQDSAISDQRLLWMLIFIPLLVRGPGYISIDWVAGQWFKSEREAVPY